MIILPLAIFAFLAWLRPRIALGVLLASIPFYEITRFTIAGIPFTFPEVATYVLAGVAILRWLIFSSFRASSEKSHAMVPPSNGVRSLALLGMTRWWKDPWVALTLLWVLVAAVAAIGSPGGMRAWGIWKAYFVAPVLLFWIIIHTARQSPDISSFRTREAGEKSHIGAPPNNGVRSLASLGMTNSMVLPLALGAFIVAVVAILQRWWPIGVPYPWSVPGKFRATSVFGYPNAVGLFLAPLVPLLIGAALSFLSSFRAKRAAASVVEKSHTMESESNGVRSLGSGLGMTIGYGFIVFLSLLAIWFAKSTGALVALTISLLTTITIVVGTCRRMVRTPALPTDYPKSHDREKVDSSSRNHVKYIAVWVLVSLMLTLWLPNQPERLRWGSPIVQKLTFQKWSGSVRLSQYRETWALLSDHPIRGAGLAGYRQAIRPYHEDSRVETFLYPHNLLLAVWVELGLAGVLIFFTLLYQFYRKLFSLPLDGRGSDLSRPERRERRWEFRFGIAAAMLVVLMHGLVDVPYFKNDLAMLFWVMMAIGTAAVVSPRQDRAIT